MIDFGYGVQLVPISDQHLYWIFECRNNIKIREWCRQHTLLNELVHRGWYQLQAQDPTMCMFVINNIDNKPVGVCGLTSIDHRNSRAEFSCWIDPDEQQKGYCTNGLKTLFAHGFKDLNLNIIWGETFDGNPALRIFREKLGMKYEGARRQFYFKGGKYIDAHLISITKDEFMV